MTDLAQRIQAVQRLHEPTHGKGSNQASKKCRECGFSFPCLTVQLLNGENLS